MTQHAGPVIGARDNLMVIDCHRCGFAHLDPLPDSAALDEYYRADFWQREKPGALAQIEAQWEWLSTIYGDWMMMLERHISAGEPQLLDVGCGFGHFMRAVEARGWRRESDPMLAWKAQGIDPSREAVAVARQNGLSVFEASWHDCHPEGFHVLSALWLLEHLPDPFMFLRWARLRLLTGGLLLIAVPNDFSDMQRAVNGRVKVKQWWIHKTHCNYFNWTTLANLLGRAGFRIVEQTTMYPMEHFLFEGLDYTDDPALGAKCHAEVEQHDLAMSRADRIQHYNELAARGQGRELIAVCVKE